MSRAGGLPDPAEAGLVTRRRLPGDRPQRTIVHIAVPCKRRYTAALLERAAYRRSFVSP